MSNNTERIQTVTRYTRVSTGKSCTKSHSTSVTLQANTDSSGPDQGLSFDELLVHINGFGLYQKRLYLLIILPVVFGSFSTMSAIFYLSEHPHRCAVEFDNNDTYMPFGRQREIQNISHNKNMTYRYSECKITRYISSLTNSTELNYTQEMCTSWIYDTEVYTETVISDMNLVCEREALKSHGKMVVYFGYLIGGFLGGFFADIYGRKPVVCICLIVKFASNLATVWAPNYTVFAFLRFLYGLAGMGYFTTAIVLGVEMVGPSKRKWTGFVIYFFWCFGEFLLCGVAFLFRNWRTIQLIVSVPMGFFIMYYWLITESPRWLLSRGKYKEAIALLKKASLINKMACEDNIFENITLEERKVFSVKSTLLSLMKSPKMLLTTGIMSINWFIVSAGFHGISLNVGNLVGDVYLNFLISIIVEMFAYATCILLFDRVGRRVFHCTNLLIGGVTCVLTIIPTIFSHSANWIVVCIAMIGKFALSAVFATIFVFSSELYPTSVRSLALGVLNLTGTTGSLTAPYVSDITSFISTSLGTILPVTVIGSSMVLAGLLSFLLPETAQSSLPESIEEAESRKK